MTEAYFSHYKGGDGMLLGAFALLHFQIHSFFYKKLAIRNEHWKVRKIKKLQYSKQKN